MHTPEDLTNKTFGRLLVLKRAPSRNGRTCWLCLCTCGTFKEVRAASLKSGSATSCGCKRREGFHEMMKQGTLKGRGIEHLKWAGAIKSRDGKSCFLCEHPSKLAAHHLYSYHAHPELRVELTNGITLCDQCHKEFHKMFSFKFNNPEQFVEFREYYFDRMYSEMDLNSDWHISFY